MFNLALGRMGRVGNITGIQRAIAFLRSLGTSAHVWLPGANGVSVASLPSNNYLLSDGGTGYSPVDGVDGLTLDGMGELGAELIASNDLSAATVTGSCVKNSSTQFTLSANGVGSRINMPLAGTAPIALFHAVRIKADKVCTLLASNLWTTGKSLALTTSYQTFEFVLADGTAPHAQNLSFYTTADSPVVVDVEYVSSKAYSGTHLTQATTANKPLVRRGMLCLPTYSDTIANAAWAKYQCSVSGALITATASGYPSISQAVTTTSGAPYTLAAIVSPGNQNTACLELRGAGIMPDAIFNASTGAFVSGSGSSVSVGSGRYLAAINKTATAASSTAIVGVGTLLSGGTINVHAIMIAPGTWTAAQILAEGGIPTTTATAASNPSAGKYWWSFDGSNDSLLSGNLGITNACTIVVAGRVNSLAATQMLFAETTNGVQVSIATDGSVSFAKVGDAALVATAAGVVVAGVPFVLTARLSAGTADIRKNGAQSATAASATVFAAVTGARIGTAFDGTTSPTGGALGWVVPLPVALSDAECLTVERLVSSQFPNGPVF